MIKTVKYIILMMVVLLSGKLSAQQAESSLDSAEMLIGDQIPLYLRFTAPEQTKVQWPYQQDTVTKKIEIINQGPVDTVVVEEGVQQLSQKLIITSFDTGYLAIPPFSFNYTMDGNQGQAKTDPLLLHVKPMAVDTSKAIKSIKGPMKAPLTFMDILPWILLGLAIILAGLLIWYIIWRKMQKKPILPVKRVPREPADVEAMNALETLKQQKLWQQGAVKAHHSELSHILRVYLERRFSIPAVESASADIFTEMANEGLSANSFKLLKEILELSDLVKFARMEPLPSDNEKVVEEAIQFVEETSPAETISKVEAENKEGGTHVE